ncbi:hypothetical protein Syun_011244 [Stephania yunnanensis]|uniref:Uncharacterized protein n=1 Tax=Stephania yunnanensis TaxID=152371 RepID=A0AAP0JXW8_9MAGN
MLTLFTSREAQKYFKRQGTEKRIFFEIRLWRGPGSAREEQKTHSIVEALLKAGFDWCSYRLGSKPRPQSKAREFLGEKPDGVVFALSGFVNPERSVLRSQAMEMDAEYRTDWNPSALSSSQPSRILPSSRQVVA